MTTFVTFNRLLLLLFVLAFAGIGQAQNNDDSEEATWDTQFPNSELPNIISEYERLTNKRAIRDASIQDRTLTIIPPKPLSYEEAAKFIEQSLLLNGYAIIPTEDPDVVKVVAYDSKPPRSEGLTVVATPEQIPAGDQLVTYIMTLTYLAPDKAKEIFESAVQLHAYGNITSLPEASSVIITESSHVIRSLVSLKNFLDVRPVLTIDRSFQLERADAESVVETLNEILDLDDEEATTPNAAPVPPNPNNAATPPATPTVASVPNIGAVAKPSVTRPKISAIPRANRVLVVSTPIDMEYIANIIGHLDAPASQSNYMRIQLKYLEVANFLEIAGDVLQRGLETEGGSSSPSGQGNQSNQNRFSNNNNSQGGSSGGSGDLGDAGSDEAVAPQSIVIDKTLLVADNVQNMLIASGPPEHLRLISELVDTMDVRPRQIQISAVIAQLNLSDDFDLGFDVLRSLDTNGTGNQAGLAGAFGSTGNPLLDVSTLTDVNNLIPAAQGLTLYGQINQSTDLAFSALASTNRFEILSRPTIYTTNSRLASIETGQRVAVPRSTLSSVDNNNQVVTSNIDFEDVVLRIDVVPLINADDEITLQIRQRNDNIIGNTSISGNNIPLIGTQVLGTTITVKDGGTVLLGGLISEEDQKTESGLPLFTNFPFVGRVFGDTDDRLQRQELLIFIQPRIIDDAYEHTLADQDLQQRTKVSEMATEFATNEANNLEVFESQDYNSAEKRVFFFRDLFKKNKTRGKSKPAGIRAVPVE